jgi:hypothetical protein
VSFNRPDRIYRRLVETLSLPNDPVASTDPPRTIMDPDGSGAPTDPVRTVMDRWADEALPRLVGTSRSQAIAFRLSAVGLLPRETRGIPPRTRLALVGFLIATEQRREDARRELVNVLRGVGHTNTELVHLAHELGYEPGYLGWTPTAYDARYHFGQLRVLLHIVRALGYPGMVVLFDEAVTLVELATRSREKACRVLDGLLFNEYQYQGLYAIFAYMPALLDRLDADQERLGVELVARWRELWRERTREIAPLSAPQMLELVEQLAHLHGIARGWEAWPSIAVGARRLVALCLARRLTTRDLVRKGVALLESRYAESGPTAQH